LLEISISNKEKEPSRLERTETSIQELHPPGRTEEQPTALQDKEKNTGAGSEIARIKSQLEQ
jgi:hypothetical protein